MYSKPDFSMIYCIVFQLDESFWFGEVYQPDLIYLKVKIMQFNCAGLSVSQTRSSRTSWKKKKVFVKSSSLSTFGVWGYNFGEKSEDFFITSCWVCVAKVVSIEEVKHASLAPSYLLKKVITVLKFWDWAIIFHVISSQGFDLSTLTGDPRLM